MNKLLISKDELRIAIIEAVRAGGETKVFINSKGSIFTSNASQDSLEAGGMDIIESIAVSSIGDLGYTEESFREEAVDFHYLDDFESDKIIFDCDLQDELESLKQKYTNVLDVIHTKKADGDLAKLCNLRDEFDETFDTFFDKKELRSKYRKGFTFAWNDEKNEPNFDVSNGDLEELLDTEDLCELITFYEGYIDELEDELIDLKSNCED